jgi:hypothetical protein
MEFLTGKILCTFALPLRWARLTRVNEDCAWTLIDLLACVRHGNAATSHPCHAWREQQRAHRGCRRDVKSSPVKSQQVKSTSDPIV